MGDWGRRGSTALGRRSERLCIRVRWRIERATEGSRRPSLIKRGNIEKVATVMNQWCLLSCCTGRHPAC